MSIIVKKFIGFREGEWVLLGVANTEGLAFGKSLKANETDMSSFEVTDTTTCELGDARDTAIKCKSGTHSYDIIIMRLE